MNDRENPYLKCITYEFLGKSCDGPNFLAMTTDQFCEWCKLRKEYLGWTNSKIADLAEISKISVDRVISGNAKDSCRRKHLADGCRCQ